MQKQRTEIEFCALFRCSPQKFSFFKLWHNTATPHACRLITRNRINTAPTIKNDDGIPIYPLRHKILPH